MYKNKLSRFVSTSALAIMLVLSGCSSDKTPPRVAYKPSGIVISYNSVANLNSYDQSPHSVMLAIYQLDNINAFHQLSTNKAGIQKLLTLNKFDPSVLGVDKRFVYANESGVITLDRLENTRWVGIVAGYYNLNQTQAIQEVQIPKDPSDTLYVNLQLDANTLQEVKDK
jgi:type VI secretion system VasD/TssJ family lipoprotein